MVHEKLIVVGVDGSEESRQALLWACQEARVHGWEVQALSAWTPPPIPIDPPFGSFPWGASGKPPAEVATMLDQVVHDVATDYPDVTLRHDVVTGNAAQELIDRSGDADLLVVGAKGHGGFVGMLLGSVSQHVLAHSACPVTVVR